jgi:hypothetical protein
MMLLLTVVLRLALYMEIARNTMVAIKTATPTTSPLGPGGLNINRGQFGKQLQNPPPFIRRSCIEGIESGNADQYAVSVSVFFPKQYPMNMGENEIQMR